MRTTVLSYPTGLEWGSFIPTMNPQGSVLTPVNEKPQTSHTDAASQDLEDIQASLRGDENAYARIMRRYQDTVTAQMWKFTRDRNELEELVHEVYVQAFLSLPKFRGDAPLIHWLRRIATFTGYKFWQKKSKYQERHTDISELVHLAADNPEDKPPDEAAELLFKMLEKLHSKDRLILTLHYFDGYDMQEVADQLGWNRTVVKVRAHRARKKLKTLMEKAGYRREES